MVDSVLLRSDQALDIANAVQFKTDRAQSACPLSVFSSVIVDFAFDSKQREFHQEDEPSKFVLTFGDHFQSCWLVRK